MLITNWLRLFYNQNGTITDLSLKNQDESTNMVFTSWNASTHELIIGKMWPFNNVFIWVETANTNTCDMQVQYFDSRNWIDAVDVLDGTSVDGKSLGQSGVLQFSPKEENIWQRIHDTSKSNNRPDELANNTLYNMFYLKIKFSAAISDNTAIKKIFYHFTDEQTVGTIDKDLARYKTALGITDLNSEIHLASKEILTMLKIKKTALNEGQILRLEDVYLPCAYKVLANLYFNFGADFEDRLKTANTKASDLLKVENYNIDYDQDGFLDKQEIDAPQRGMVRQ